MLKGAPEAEDLWQETFLRVHLSLSDYREEGQARAWIFRIAKNCLTDHYRKAKRSPVQVELQEGDRTIEEEPHEVIHSQDLEKRFVEAIESLPEAQREVYLLRQREGLSFKEIEKVTGESRTRLAGRMHLALKRLHKVMEGDK